MAEDSDRRIHARHGLVMYLEVFDRSSNQPFGRAVDVSRTGMMVVGDHELSAAKEYHLKVILPSYEDEHGEMKNQVIDFDAVCRWSRPDVNPEFFGSGLEFSAPELMEPWIEAMVGLVSFAG